MNPEENKGQENTSSPSVAPVATNPAPRITESKLEVAHATLPPMSVIGASTEPAVKPGTISTPKQFGRRGTPSNVAPSGKTANSRPSIGVIENPAQVTESLSGELAKQPRPTQAAPASYQAPREPRHEQPRHDQPRHEQPRFERDSRPPQYRAPREPREPQHERQENAHAAPQARREQRPERQKLHIDPVVIPEQSPIGFWANLKRKIASLFGIPVKSTATAVQNRNHPRSRGPRDYRDGPRPRDGQGGPRRGSRPNFRRQGPRQG
ncbi:MAG: hypothetical protein WCJ77_04165 [Opitutae bacterium]